MIIQDRVYGQYTIEEPVLIELIESEPFQRLKGISQHGVPAKFFPYEDFYRHEHCIGVMILLRKIGATLEEQIAGLLHDVSHTAFSHTIDWVIGNNVNEEYADSQHKHYLQKTGLDLILKKYGYDFERIADPHQFSLLEQDSPDLCADRIDYALRDFLLNVPDTKISDFKDGFVPYEGKIVCKDYQTALDFAQEFLWCQENIWGAQDGVSRYRWFAKALKYAVEDRLINLEDFWHDDNFVLTKLEASTNPHIQKILTILSQKSLQHLPVSEEIHQKKFRHVDPLFLNEGTLVRLSNFDSNFKTQLEIARKENAKGIHCAIIE